MPDVRGQPITGYTTLWKNNQPVSDPTIEAGDFRLSIDGGAFASLTDLPQVTPAGSEQVAYTLDSAETDGDHLVLLWEDQDDEWESGGVEIITEVNDFVAAEIWDYPTADATTLGSIGKWILDHLDRAISSLGTVVLTPVSDVTAVNYTRTRGDEWLINMTLGDLTGWTRLDIMLKADTNDGDGSAAIHVRLTNPSSGNDGLQLLNGVSATKAWGSLEVNDTGTGDVNFKPKAEATSVQAAGDLVYDIQGLFSSGRAVRTLQKGIITVTEDVVREID